MAWTSKAFTRWRPVVSDGTVYLTNFDPSKDGSVFALDAQDGTEQWRTTLDASGENGMALVDDRLVVAYDTTLVALDRQSGERIWTETTNGLKFSELLVADDATGTILLASEDGIEAFGAANGEQHWESDVVRGLSLAPAVAGERVFAVGEIDGAPSLAAISLADGSERWQTELTDHPWSVPPVVTESGVVVDDDGTLVVYDPETGERRRELFTFTHENGVHDIVGLGTANGTVFAASYGGVVAVDAETGAEQWYRDRPESKSELCVGSQTVVLPLSDPSFASNQTTISALDRETGEMRWYWDFGRSPNVIVPPVMVDDAVFFTASDMDSLAVLGDVPPLED